VARHLEDRLDLSSFSISVEVFLRFSSGLNDRECDVVEV
jgi:hypothetical protein